jgi:NAD(P)-dependent dehydrogenase (short-subunit alcohol dehydrogenase family)
VVTGGASGIGAALVRLLASQGASVVIADIEIDRAEAVAADIRAARGDAVAVLADHADQASLDALADTAFERFATVDLVVANAGVGVAGALHLTPQRNLDWVLAVNLGGPIGLAQAFVPRMIDQESPSCFAITGSEHSLGLPERGGTASAYTVSKHAVLGVAETLRRDLADTGVAVSIICPAMVATDIWNPLRTRHERFGGPRVTDESRRPPATLGLPATEAATRVLAGLESGEFYVLTHGADIADVHHARAREIDDTLARFRERYGTDV